MPSRRSAPEERRGAGAPGVRGPGGPWVLVGLGNPGRQYARNRHNVGAMAVTALAQEYGQTPRPHRSRCLVARFTVPITVPITGPITGHGGPASVSSASSVSVVVAQPAVFMNEAGGPVKALLAYFSVGCANLVVVHDDLELRFGEMRVKAGGGTGGHNGLRSLTRAMGTGEYTRLRIGIGRPPGRQDPADFVLRDFSKSELGQLPVLMAQARDVLHGLIGGSA